MSRRLALATSLWLSMHPTAPAHAEPEVAGLAARLERVEARLDLIDRKFSLLSAGTAQELLGTSELLASPAMLLEQARAMVVAERVELGYAYLKLLRTLHPESPESRDAFGLAAAIFQRRFSQTRVHEPESRWVTSEPAFVFEWLGAFYGEEPPQRHAEAVFRGMPYGVFRHFQAHTQHRPAFARWAVSVEEDNGIIERVVVTPGNRSTSE